MARRYLSLSGIQAVTRRAAPSLALAPYADTNGNTSQGASNGDAYWPLVDNYGTLGGGGVETPSTIGPAVLVTDDVVKVPNVRAITLAPHTDVDAMMIQFGEEKEWQFLGPGRAVYAKGETDYFRARPALPLIGRNMVGGSSVPGVPGGGTGNYYADGRWYGDGILELWINEVPHVLPQLLPTRTVVLKAFTINGSASAAPSVDPTTGKLRQHILATPGFNIERVEFLFHATNQRIVRAAIGHMYAAVDAGSNIFDGPLVQEDYSEIQSAILRYAYGAAAAFDWAAPVIAVLVGTPDAADYIVDAGCQLVMVRRFIG